MSQGTLNTRQIDSTGADATDTVNRAVRVNVVAGAAGGGAATIADGADVTQGALADAAVVTDTTGTLSGKLRGLVKWAFERMPTSLGQKAMAASFPVVIASDQSAVTIAGTVTANAGTDLNTSTLATEATLLTRTKPADQQHVIIDSGTTVVTDGGSSLTVDGALTAQAVVATNDPAPLDGATTSLSMTTAGRLRIDTEAGVRDFDGVTALYTADRVLRRYAEQAAIDAYAARFQAAIQTEWESSHRMGFEVR